MCKEMPVIPVNEVAERKIMIEKWRAEEQRPTKNLTVGQFLNGG
jgi:hypothetical protein